MTAIPSDRLRIIDANLNRIGEGLRFLEEFARLTLNDTSMTGQLKNMRHELLALDSRLQQQLINARDSEGDVGVDMEAPGQEKQPDIQASIVANARRVQEAMRVLEELAKTPEIPLNSELYKRARFMLYTLEKTLLSRLLRKNKIERLAGLYVIVDTASLKGKSHVEVASQAIRGGARVIQLRDKEHNKKELIEIAEDLKKLCSKNEVLFTVNDSLDVALASDADGLHIGQDDLPTAVARRLLPVDKLLGCTARTVEEANQAAAEGADYIGVGAIYATATKAAAEAVGPGRIKEIIKAVDLPIVAIGGINKDNIRDVLDAGARSVSVISAVLGAPDIEKASRQMVNIIEGEYVK